MKLQDLDIKGFMAATSGSDPVPGGGSISALCGALSAALAEMVTGLTIGRKKYVEVEEEMKALAPKMAEAQVKFLQFIDDDADAYNVVFAVNCCFNNTAAAFANVFCCIKFILQSFHIVLHFLSLFDNLVHVLWAAAHTFW